MSGEQKDVEGERLLQRAKEVGVRDCTAADRENETAVSDYRRSERNRTNERKDERNNYAGVKIQPGGTDVPEGPFRKEKQPHFRTWSACMSEYW